jgi:hypothetical protein
MLPCNQGAWRYSDETFPLRHPALMTTVRGSATLAMAAAAQTGAKGPEIAYEARLDNSQRDLLPAHMLRWPAAK